MSELPATRRLISEHDQALRSQVQEFRSARQGIHTGIYYGFAQFPQLRAAYLRHCKTHGNPLGAACSVGMTAIQIRDWRESHEDFARDEVAALEAHKEEIETAIKQRAIEGWEEEKFNPNGGSQGSIRRYSDQLLIAYARRHIQEYRDAHNSRTTIDGKVEVSHRHSIEARELTSEQRAALRLLLAPEPPPPQLKIIVETAEPAEPPMETPMVEGEENLDEDQS